MRIPGHHLATMISREGHVRAALAYRRLLREARRLGDEDDFETNTPWPDLVELFKFSRGAHLIVELGTGNAWAALLLAAENRSARVVTFDPFPRAHRDDYLREFNNPRVELRGQRGDDGPQELRDVDLLFIDSSHEYEDTLAEFQAWEPVVRKGGYVAFHDYGRRWDGVTRAVDELALEGHAAGTSLYVWRKPLP